MPEVCYRSHSRSGDAAFILLSFRSNFGFPLCYISTGRCEIEQQHLYGFHDFQSSARGMRPRPDPVVPGQESVWSYPRPAIAEPTSARIVIEHRGVIVADTRSSIRTLETSHPPSYYIPRSDIAAGVLRRATGSSFCEWKGTASYWDVVIGDSVLPWVGWSYANPSPGFAALRDHVAFYAGPFERCTVDGEIVIPQPGDFYGGWITSRLAGPFKGVPGSRLW